MARVALRFPTLSRRGGGADAGAILDALAYPVLVLDADDRVININLAAEGFFACSQAMLLGHLLSDHVPEDSPLFSLVRMVRAEQGSRTEYGLALENPRMGRRLVTADVAPMADRPGAVVVSLHERSIAVKLDRQLTHRGAARSVSAMAEMLAHEVKNPMSGIRGAAQLLDQTVPPEDRTLTRLIIDEVDRVVALVDRMEVFSDSRPMQRGPVNIHQVLEHVRRVAQNGFARRVRMVERYDPSLPPVFGNRDQLIQVFLNLVKNAAEAVPEEGGEILLVTGYQHGVRLQIAGSDARVQLPLVVTVQDNGPGIPEDLRPHLFDPFVTTKVNGSGLGLALVAKIVGDHGGVIEFDSQPRRTLFRVMLPVSTEAGA
ncbi:MAG: PAS domain-containing protein [Alphaproteobacteria bacterium]|nr:ATP-binding protein [Alphaproteobacteria bacterium]TAD91921.1 MAG: PAS domain-containing protein [Alphaproteobacteria bacterium]